MSKDKTLAFLSGEETSNCDLHTELTLHPDFQQEASEGKGGTEGGNERTTEMRVIRLFFTRTVIKMAGRANDRRRSVAKSEREKERIDSDKHPRGGEARSRNFTRAQGIAILT